MRILHFLKAPDGNGTMKISARSVHRALTSLSVTDRQTDSHGAEPLSDWISQFCARIFIRITNVLLVAAKPSNSSRGELSFFCPLLDGSSEFSSHIEQPHFLCLQLMEVVSQRTNFCKIPHKSPKNQILHFPPCQPQLYQVRTLF